MFTPEFMQHSFVEMKLDNFFSLTKYPEFILRKKFKRFSSV